MVEQLDLLAPKVRTSDPVTSHVAAGRTANVTRRVEGAFRAFGPMTDDELCRRIEPDVRRWPTIKSARSRLKGARVLVASGVVRHGQQEWRLS